MTSTRIPRLSHRTCRPGFASLIVLILLTALLSTSLSAALTTSSATATTPPGWSGPVQVDPPHGSPAAISCPSSTFCAAVDKTGDAFVLHGSGWSAPTRIDTDGLGSAIPQQDLSCASATFCASVDTQGRAITYDGTRWSAPVDIDSTTAIESVSCPTSSFCMAADGFGYVMTFNGTSWGSPMLADPGKAGLDRRISCASASFCALMSSGSVRTFNGSTWSAPTTIGLGPILYAISCTSSTFCVAEGANGFSGPGVQIFNGTTWSAPSEIGGGTDVSCTSATFCAVVNSGTVSTYNGASWTGPTSLAYGLASVACASSTFCAAIGSATLETIGTRTVEDTGAVYTFNGASWSAPVPVDSSGGGVGSVSCPTTSSCIAAFTGMDASAYQGGTWTYRHYIDNATVAANAGPGISCPSATFCAAVNFSGDVLTWNGTTWSAPVEVASGLSSVSCPTTTFCAAVSGSGDVVTYNGASWTLPAKIDAADGLTSVSCPTSSFCAAVDESLNVVVFNGTSWASPAGLGLGIGGWPGAISCTSSTFCAVVSKVGAVTFDGAHWSTPSASGIGRAVSCTSSTFCMSVGSQKSSLYNGTTWSSPTTVVVAPGVALDAVSCAAPSFCLALTTAGTAYTYGGVVPNPVRTAGPRVTGTPHVGHTLTCSVTYSGATTVRYGWTRNGAAIAGAVGVRYHLALRDNRTRIGCNTQAANTAGGTTSIVSASTVLVGLDAMVNHRRPRIVGTVKAKKKVHANPGTWAPAATSYTYQWLVGGKPIRGATRAAFKIPRADRHRPLSVNVTAHRSGYAAGVSTSRATKVR